jgi:hypothetical protein
MRNQIRRESREPADVYYASTVGRRQEIRPDYRPNRLNSASLSRFSVAAAWVIHARTQGCFAGDLYVPRGVLSLVLIS